MISDELPEGLAYVPNSLQVDGDTVTDAKDDDNGDFTNGTVSGQFGDIKDTDWHTVTFEVTVEKDNLVKTFKIQPMSQAATHRRISRQQNRNLSA